MAAAIFDEVHSIKIPSCRSVDALFYWVITANYTLLHNISNTGFLRQVFGDRLDLKSLQSIVVQVAPAAMDTGASQFPPHVRCRIVCKSAAVIRIYQTLAPGSRISQMLHENLLNEAKTALRAQLQTQMQRRSLASQYASYGGGSNSSSMNHMNQVMTSARATGGLLELQLCAMLLNGRAAPVMIEAKCLLLLRLVWRMLVCMHCDKNILCKDGLWTSCCGVLYCTACRAQLVGCIKCGSIQELVCVLGGEKEQHKGRSHPWAQPLPHRARTSGVGVRDFH